MTLKELSDTLAGLIASGTPPDTVVVIPHPDAGTDDLSQPLIVVVRHRNIGMPIPVVALQNWVDSDDE